MNNMYDKILESFNVLDKDGKNYVTGKFGIVNVG